MHKNDNVLIILKFLIRLYRMQEPSSASPNFSEYFKSDSQSEGRRTEMDDHLQVWMKDSNCV